jgi:hypothetical protein
MYVVNAANFGPGDCAIRDGKAMVLKVRDGFTISGALPRGASKHTVLLFVSSDEPNKLLKCTETSFSHLVPIIFE